MTYRKAVEAAIDAIYLFSADRRHGGSTDARALAERAVRNALSEKQRQRLDQQQRRAA